MVVIDVAMVICKMCSWGKLKVLKRMVRNGTIIIPPPMPRSPATIPVTEPRHSNKIICRVVRQHLS
jgi:hypothetical protein